MTHSGRGNATRGITLVELLVVVGIILLMMVLAVPAISNLNRSFNAARAGAVVREHLELARQHAVTRNEAIVVSFINTTDASGHQGFNVLQLSRRGNNGALIPLERPVRLPAGYALAEDGEWSSIIAELPSATIQFDSGPRDSKEILFEARGAADLPLESQWFLTIHNAANEAEPDANFITLVIDPPTGRTFAYHP